MIKVTAKMFVDPLLNTRVTKMNRRGLNRAGSLLRRGARQSIRRTKAKPSAAGQPPKTHGHGQYSLKNILYGVDENKLSVVIGYSDDKLSEVAAVHEHAEISKLKRPAFRIGSRVLIPRYKVRNEHVTISKRAGAKPKIIKNKYDIIAASMFFKARLRGRRVKYDERKFLEPELERDASKAVKLWEDSL